MAGAKHTLHMWIRLKVLVHGQNYEEDCGVHVRNTRQVS